MIGDISFPDGRAHIIEGTEWVAFDGQDASGAKVRFRISFEALASMIGPLADVGHATALDVLGEYEADVSRIAAAKWTSKGRPPRVDLLEADVEIR